jgi:lysophospholipase L1-like esterase
MNRLIYPFLFYCAWLMAIFPLSVLAKPIPCEFSSKKLKLPDINCNNELQISVIGDSIVAGIGDSLPIDRKINLRGYVLRAARKLKSDSFTMLGFGYPGLTANDLWLTLRGMNRENNQVVIDDLSELEEALLLSDYTVLDIGRNDRWDFEPQETLFILRKAKRLIERIAQKKAGIKPIVVIPTLLLPNRGSQGPWVAQLNELLLDSKEDITFGLRFDIVSKRLLNEDQLHPNVEGYDSIADIFTDFLTKVLPKKVAKLFRSI